MNSILLVGAGQIGSRYLQGLAVCLTSLEIFVVDISKNSLATAKNRWKEVVNVNSQHKIHFSKTFHDLPKEVDLCLVPTTADSRLYVIQQVLGKVKVKYWVLEKVLVQSVKQIELLEELLSDSHGAWVNTSRRTFSWHQEIYQKLPKNISWQVVGEGSGWGMACNSIHFIDLISWWTGEELVSVDNSGLGNWFPSKRERFWEVNGTLKSFYSGGSQLELISGSGSSPFSLNLKNDEGLWRLEEGDGIFKGPKEYSLSGKEELQSEITGSLVEKILKLGECPLTTLEESAKMHSIFIESLLKHWNAYFKSVETVLPIT